MNPDLTHLHPYPFEKLAQLKADVTPAADLTHIPLTIGEPRHPAPESVLTVLRDALPQVSHYPGTKGLLALREAIAQWCQRRFGASLEAETQVLPVNGTREALFAFVQTVLDRSRPATVLMPNPFYQIYEGATLLAGGQPHYLPCLEADGFIPDFEAITPDVWENTQLLFICSPGNPTGAVMPLAVQQRLIALADQYDFVIAADECYSEIYHDETMPPPGLLQACVALGRHDFKRCVVFHSLSKRSNLPGLRSGFVAGDAAILSDFLRYRTYHGCAMPLHHQQASIAAWQDETHVRENREAYRAKFDAVLEILQPVMAVQRPDAGFYLWPAVPGGDDEAFAMALLREQNLGVLPGRYLSRAPEGVNPGAGRVRMALVAELSECIEGAKRIRRCVEKGDF